MNMVLPRYLVLVGIDQASRSAVTLFKQTGSRALLNKIVFPGGRIAADDPMNSAASLLMLEQTGIKVPRSAWKLVEVRKTHISETLIFAALVDSTARTLTRDEEPQLALGIDMHTPLARAEPDNYAPEFLSILSKALSTLKLEPLVPPPQHRRNSVKQI